MKKRVLSGVQPTGELHIGNYLGAIKQFVELQDYYQSLFCIVDYHAITAPFDPKKLRAATFEVAALYLAAGINPKKSILFKQSAVSGHTELGWILNNIAYFGEVSRMTQFKDKYKEKGENVTVGFFDYPVLMAADILLYNAAIVPVGEDQRQHIELTRDITERFNNKFGRTFAVPQTKFSVAGSKVMSLSNPKKKMSKSDPDEKSKIKLSDSPEVIRGKIRRAVTDSGTDILFDPIKKPAISNLLSILSGCSGIPIKKLEGTYRTASYAAFKDAVAEAVVATVVPLQEKLAHYRGRREDVERILAEGARQARPLAEKTLADVKKKIGVL